MPDNFKSVVYRGGVVTFRIPSHWVEHYEPEGGGEFFEDAPDTPTLRLNVMTMQGPAATPDAAASALSGYGRVERRADGTAVVRYAKESDEEGALLRIHYWQIAQPLPPNHMRILVFSLTTLASQQNDPGVVETIALLERELLAARLAQQVGEVST